MIPQPAERVHGCHWRLWLSSALPVRAVAPDG